MSIKALAEKLQEWRRYRTSVRELTQLSDRELADLGITRSEIEYIAKKSARL
jgi:uncharacterized protein YjiS (DUF1127 family)